MSINYPTLVHFSHFSSLLTNFPSTTVENSLQISPFYAKQSQSQVRQNQHKHFCNNEICKNGQLVIQTKQTQFKANKAKNKPNSNPIKANKAKNKANLSKGQNCWSLPSMLAHLLWSLPSGVLTCFSAGGRGLLRG